MTRYPLIQRSITTDGAVASAPAKLNLWLEVLHRRPDAFHEIETLMVPVGLFDRLEIRVRGDLDHLQVVGGDAPSNRDNLVMKALDQARTTRSIPPLEIILEKVIPSRAGLGGGSSDGAAMLVLLDTLFSAPGGGSEVVAQAANLGSDVPFFLGSGAALARGRGERLSPAPEPLLGGDRAHFNLLLPDIGVDTATAYASLSDYLTSADSHRNFQVCDFIEKSAWTGSMYNRLLDGVRQIEPSLDEIAILLNRVFPGRWTMTGSGSCFVVAAPDQSMARRDAALLRANLDELGKGSSGLCPLEILEVPLWNGPADGSGE